MFPFYLMSTVGLTDWHYPHCGFFQRVARAFPHQARGFERGRHGIDVHFRATRVQMTSEQGGRCQWFSRGPLHQTLNMVWLEFFGRSAAWQIRQRGHGALAPTRVRNTYCARAQAHLTRHLFSKDARVQ